jgi:hypothetical protein
MKFISIAFLAMAARSASGFAPLAAATNRAAFSTKVYAGKLPVVASEEVMSKKSHGTSEKPVMKELRWSCDYEVADRICNFNRHYAEYAGTYNDYDTHPHVQQRTLVPLPPQLSQPLIANL